MQNTLLIASGAIAIFGSVGHSFLSERVILRPLFAETGSTVLKNARTRDIVRAVFHIPSLAWGLLGAALILAGVAAASAPLLVVAAAAVFLASGLANFAALRRVHPGAVVLISAGIFAIAGLSV